MLISNKFCNGGGRGSSAVMFFNAEFYIKDGDGFYYWHISSGTIQREPPRDTKTNHANDIVR